MRRYEQSTGRRFPVALDELAELKHVDEQPIDVGALLEPPSEQLEAPPRGRLCRPGPKSKAQRRKVEKRARARRRARNERRDARRARDLCSELERRGYGTTIPGELELEGHAPAQVSKRPLRIVPMGVQNFLLAINLDRKGYAARAALRAIENKVLAANARKAALCDGAFNWTDARARRVVAGAYFLDAMKRRHRGPSSRWRYKVDGVPIDFIRWLLRDVDEPTFPGQFRAEWRPGKRPYRSARGVPSQTIVSGTWRGGRWQDGECGAFTALRQLGVVFSLHNGKTPKVYATKSGYQPVEFMILSDVPELAAEGNAAELEASILLELAIETAELGAGARAPPLRA